ncbi:NAD-dependent epimerase/dehydratase family protein [Paenibacillus sp. MCAF9]|uniref:NAD-dependent epimerase/dehydratase family protein n=1 Tax=Paenibacillus sp. MCAF9 TaxID=3233046 RepID=UPI003F9B621B
MLYITGITGHSGNWFLEKLESEKYNGKIRCIVRKNSVVERLKNSSLDIEIVYCDLNDIEQLRKSMLNVTTVVHIASIFHSERVVSAALENNVEWLILVHTTGRYSSYKSASEEYIRIEDSIMKKREKIGITILRPTMIYGSSNDRNMYKLIGYLSKFKFFPMFGKGENLMQPVHAKDLGYAYFDVLVNRSKTFNKEYSLSGKDSLKYINLIRCVSHVINKKNIIVKIPLSISIVAARVYNKLFKNAVISVEQVLRMQEDKAFDHEAALRDFNYTPISFEEGIKGEVEEFKRSSKKREII